MTPGDFGSLQEGREGLSTEDYIAWKLPEEEDEAEEYTFPLTLRAKKGSATASPSGLDGQLDNSIVATGGNASDSIASGTSQVSAALSGKSTMQSTTQSGQSMSSSSGYGLDDDTVGATNGDRLNGRLAEI